MRKQLLEIPAGPLGTAATIRKMQGLVSRGKRDPEILNLAASIVKNSGTRARDHLNEVGAIYKYINSRMNYIWDPVGVETIYSPKQALRRGAGDCDCLSTLFNTMAEAIGLRTVFVTIKDPNYPTRYSHVYSRVYIPERRQWVNVDLANKDEGMGWEHMRAKIPGATKIWRGSRG